VSGVRDWQLADGLTWFIVDRSASDRDIRAAYKRLSKKYHPDINKAPNAEEQFVQIARGEHVAVAVNLTNFPEFWIFQPTKFCPMLQCVLTAISKPEQW
jgi:hypothetical protein